MKLFFCSTWLLNVSLALTGGQAMKVAGGGEPQTVTAWKVELPVKVGLWQRQGSPQLIAPPKIFEYMDGAGELYLAYQLDHLEVFEYTNPQQDSILVELYQLKTADDSYGLMSGDWGGDPLDLGSRIKSAVHQGIAPENYALYGAGLLRLRCGNWFARIMAYQETPQSREAVMQLGRVIAGRFPVEAPPNLACRIPGKIGETWIAQSGRLCFLRSHLVLNSIYFLSTENLLQLGPSVDAVFVPYNANSEVAGGKRPKLLLLQYPDEKAAIKACQAFKRGYLQQSESSANPDTKRNGTQKIEDGWVGYACRSKSLSLVFECPDEGSAVLFLKAVPAVE
jgi:hypothetical protein